MYSGWLFARALEGSRPWRLNIGRLWRRSIIVIAHFICYIEPLKFRRVVYIRRPLNPPRRWHRRRWNIHPGRRIGVAIILIAGNIGFVKPLAHLAEIVFDRLRRG